MDTLKDNTLKKKESDNNKDEIEKQLREQVKRLQEFINNKGKAAQ